LHIGEHDGIQQTTARLRNLRFLDWPGIELW